VPQLCEIIENVEIVRHFIFCWLVVVIFFCFAVDLQNRLFKNTFFNAFDSGNGSLVGYVKKPAKNALKKVVLPRGFVSLRTITDSCIWALVD